MRRRQPLAQKAPRHLREPVVDPREQAEDRSAEQHVVEVCHHEVGIRLLQIGRRRRVHDAAEPADREHGDETDREEHRRPEADRPTPHRRDPVEHLHAGGDRDEHGQAAERRVRDRAQAHREHVVRPHAEPEEGDQDAGVDDHRIPEQRLPREGRNDVRDDAEGRQNQDVDLRVTEDPEQVLPEHGVASPRRLEEERPEHPVEEEEDRPDRERRERQDDQKRHDQRHPREEGQPHEGEAGCPQVDDGDDEVERGDDGGRAGQREPEDVEVHPVTRRELARGEVCVREPSGAGGSPEEKARVQEERSAQEEPVAERVQARKGDVPRSDLERHDVVEGARRHRHDGEEDHRQAVHGEELIENLGAQHGVLRHRQLETDQHRLQATDEEEEEAGEEVEDPDPLVVHGRDPAPQTAGVGAAGFPFRVSRCFRCRHSGYSRLKR